MKKNSYTFILTPEQRETLTNVLKKGNYRPREVPHTTIAAEGPDCRINLYKSGKCLIQGKGAEEWITFVLEPQILMAVVIGYDEVLDPSASQPHMGIDESGKGDFFGPLVISAAFVNEKTVKILREMGVKDSKAITSDKKAMVMARNIREVLDNRFSMVTVGPEAYNRLYASMRNVNRMLAWGHARAIENLLEKVPDCPRALSDQFGPMRQIEQALLKKGRQIRLEQRPKAESDMAVAAASILARAGFLHALAKMGKDLDIEIPKGASMKVKQITQQLIEKHGAPILLRTSKCHFKTTDDVLEKLHLDRNAIGKEGLVTSKRSVEKR